MYRKRNIKSEYNDVLEGKRIPILTLDSRWHELFPEHDKPSNIRSIENKLNDLVKKQGQYNHELKEYALIKKKMMSDIVDNMEATLLQANSDMVKKLELSKKAILEINDKMEKHEEALSVIPDEIRQVNKELLEEGLHICYEKMYNNNKNIDELNSRILELRDELKDKLIDKNEKEEENNLIYSYMHDLLGHSIINLFDTKLGDNNG